MRAEILSIGTEILVGSILNTNARFLAEKLAENGIDVYHQVTVGDNPGRIVEALGVARSRADLVITTGGLGPTEDDVTAQSVAEFLGRPLALHRPTYEAIVRRLKIRRLGMTQMIERQCFVPEGAHVLPNPNGTAPGIFCENILLLPGPPRELEPMFVNYALPFLFKQLKLKHECFIRRSLKISGVIEAQVAQKVNALLKLKPPLTLGIYAKLGEVELKIMSKAVSKEKALAAARQLEKKIRARTGKWIYGTDDETLESVVGKILRAKRKTLSVAESCTGGLVSSRITRIPGSSDFFLGGVVAYSNRIKHEIIGVNPKTLARFGAVSPQTARALAENIRIQFKTDYAISVTGIAGPTGGSTTKPIGLVFIAIAAPKRTRIHRYRFLGSRADIQSRSATEALHLLLNEVR